MILTKSKSSNIENKPFFNRKNESKNYQDNLKGFNY